MCLDQAMNQGIVCLPKPSAKFFVPECRSLPSHSVQALGQTPPHFWANQRRAPALNAFINSKTLIVASTLSLVTVTMAPCLFRAVRCFCGLASADTRKQIICMDMNIIEARNGLASCRWLAGWCRWQAVPKLSHVLLGAQCGPHFRRHVLAKMYSSYFSVLQKLYQPSRPQCAARIADLCCWCHCPQPDAHKPPEDVP